MTPPASPSRPADSESPTGNPPMIGILPMPADPARGQLWADPGDGIGPPSHSTTSAVISTACNNTSAPAAAQSRLIASSSLWLSPPAQGHMIIAVGAT